MLKKSECVIDLLDHRYGDYCGPAAHIAVREPVYFDGMEVGWLCSCGDLLAILEDSLHPGRGVIGWPGAGIAYQMLLSRPRRRQ